MNNNPKSKAAFFTNIISYYVKKSNWSNKTNRVVKCEIVF